MGETTSLCKWKKVVKNGVMAMTNMTLGDFSEVLFGYPHPEIFLSVTMLCSPLAEQEFSLDHQVSTRNLFRLLIITQTRRKDISFKGSGLLFSLSS